MKAMFSLLVLFSLGAQCQSKYRIMPKPDNLHFSFRDTGLMTQVLYLTDSNFREVLILKNDALIVYDSLAAIKGLIKAVGYNRESFNELINENNRLREIVKQLIKNEPRYAIKRQQ